MVLWMMNMVHQFLYVKLGPFNGRIMWFPPYNIEINETASAKFEPTIMVGRNEPMYNYINSERSATINFTLLIDYPEQLRNFIGQNKQRDIAEFFAFGGDTLNPKSDMAKVENYQLQIEKLSTEIQAIQGNTTPSEPSIIQDLNNIKIVFPNDIPTDPLNSKTDSRYSNLNNVIDIMYNDLTYEITYGCLSSDGTGFGLNNDIYFKTGLTQTSPGEWVLNGSASQYTSTGLTDQFGNSTLNSELFRVFNDENNRKLFSVYIYGAASKLYTELNPNDIAEGTAYNNALGERRADAAIILVKKRLATMFGQKIADGIEVTYDPSAINPNATISIAGSIGDSQADVNNATAAAIPNQDTKNERYAMISIKRNNNSPVSNETQLSKSEQDTINTKQQEIATLQTKINFLKSLGNDCVYNERTTVQTDDTNSGANDGGILSGFKSVSGNYYYPVFHSQTPEDFHKRLTFLQQCTRQGASKRYTSIGNNQTQPTISNSVFGRQPICIVRIGDFLYTKVIIESVNVDYNETTWDMNPEGFGMQPMIAKVTLNIKIIGGQSLKGPIDALQNAVAYNYYANSTFTNKGRYALPSKVAKEQESYINGVLAANVANMTTNYNTKVAMNTLQQLPLIY